MIPPAIALFPGSRISLYVSSPSFPSSPSLGGEALIIGPRNRFLGIPTREAGNTHF